MWTTIDDRLDSRSTLARIRKWDENGFVVIRMREEGLTDTEIARILNISPRTVKARRARVSSE